MKTGRDHSARSRVSDFNGQPKQRAHCVGYEGALHGAGVKATSTLETCPSMYRDGSNQILCKSLYTNHIHSNPRIASGID